MSKHIGIGFSQHTNTAQATRQAALDAKIQNGQSSFDIVLIFNTIHYNPDIVFETAQSILQPKVLLGCSCAGIVTSDFVSTKGVGILALSAPDIFLAHGHVDLSSAVDARAAGVALGKDLLSKYPRQPRQAMLFFIDGQETDNDLFIRGLQEVLGSSFPIVGSCSCDDFQFLKSFQYSSDGPLTQSATGLLLGGPLSLAVGCQHGWKPLGQPRTATETDGNIIKTIEGRPAFSLYEEFFGDEAKNLQSTQFSRISLLYPLGIYSPEISEYLVRNVTSVLSDGSLVCQSEVPAGSNIHIMIGNKDFCEQASMTLAQEIKERVRQEPIKALLVLESLARLKLFGRQAYQEIRHIKDIIGYNVPIFGMYGFGEIGSTRPMSAQWKTMIQNESIILASIV